MVHSQELRGTKDEVEEQIDSIANKIAGAHQNIWSCLLPYADMLHSCSRCT